MELPYKETEVCLVVAFAKSGKHQNKYEGDTNDLPYQEAEVCLVAAFDLHQPQEAFPLFSLDTL